jgi:ABC-type spermidine/putrescine transport system permease subunit II
MATGQSRSASAFETVTSTVLGFLLSVWVQQLLFPAMGHDLALTENMVVASVYTGVSLLRGYVVRRTFNALRDQLP